MKELVFKSEKGNPVTNSLLVAEKFEKRHSDVIRAIRDLLDKLPENQCKRNFAQIEEQQIPMPLGGFRNKPVYMMTRDGFSILVMGFTGEKALKFKLDFIEAFNKMEEIIKSGGFQIPKTFADALRLAAEQTEKLEEANKQLEAQRPAVVFHESVTASNTVISVSDMAKLISQNGVETGEKRLYKWLVDEKYLICRQRWSKTKNTNVNDYMPYQRYMEMGLFFVAETIIQGSNEPFVIHTVKITGKGQTYFIDKFLTQKAA